MSWTKKERFHLMKRDMNTPACNLPGRFASGKSTADNSDEEEQNGSGKAECSGQQAHERGEGSDRQAGV